MFEKILTKMRTFIVIKMKDEPVTKEDNVYIKLPSSTSLLSKEQSHDNLCVSRINFAELYMRCVL